MAKKKTAGWRAEPLRPRIESPTWGELQRMAEAVMEEMGGPSGAASALSGPSFYALSILASLNLDDAKAKAFIFGKQYLT
jgi:hypothetical protein